MDKITRFFGMAVDGIIHFGDAKTPALVTVEGKNAVYRIIDRMLTK